MFQARAISTSAIIVIAGLSFSKSLHAEKKTIQRVDDPVVMECRELAPLFGAPIERLALMALTGGGWAPIPFQVDQKKPDGSYAYTIGPAASEDPDPNLDANDELVFMVKDIGDSVEDGKWPEGADKIMEIECSDPRNENKGWVYLARFSGIAPRAKDDYIKLDIDKARGRRGVTSYEYTVGAPLDSTVIDYVAIRTADESGAGVDLVDRQKVRGELIFPAGITVPVRIDKSAKTKDKGYIDGPVRILRLTEGYMEFGFIEIRATGDIVVEYYGTHIVFPTTIKVPKFPEFIVRFFPEMRLSFFMDFSPDFEGSHCFSAANPYNEDVVLDGRMNEAETNLDTETPIDWAAGVGPQGAIVSRLILGEKIKGLKQTPYYVDDKTIEDSPEDHPGASGVGYQLMGISDFIANMSNVTFTISLINYFKKELNPDEVWKVLDIIDHPLEVKVQAVGSGVSP